ncbi:MAG: hypothetical protein LBK25_05605 [Treponema sp.]|nr:hypothetical protein [Treponema sp.]
MTKQIYLSIWQNKYTNLQRRGVLTKAKYHVILRVEAFDEKVVFYNGGEGKWRKDITLNGIAGLKVASALL